jgi:hypothetical protein
MIGDATRKETCGAPHWFIPVRASDPTTRRDDVDKALGKYPGATLQSFWKTPDEQQLFAIVSGKELTHDILRDIGANGKPIALEDV